MDDGNFHAAQTEPVRGFQAKEAATDHHCAAAIRSGREHRVDILHVAETDDAGQVLAGHGDDEGIGARGNQQPVIGQGEAGTAGNRLAVAIDRHDRVIND